MNATIFNIQKFCTNDGPGIRTTVFFKGCPLRCLWCHNPESHSSAAQLMRYPHKCKGCGRCEGVSDDDGDFVCYHGAREWCGKTVSVDEVVEDILKDQTFYDHSGGGATLSGGEPLAQPRFALELLKRLKLHGVHTAMETCGYAPWQTLAEIAPYVDLFLFDCKETDPVRHKEFTGVDNAVILENLAALDAMGKDIILRCPIVSLCNDRPDHYAGIYRLASTLTHLKAIEIEPYHELGESKYSSLGRPAPHYETLSDEQVNAIVQLISSGTSVPVRKA